MPKLYIIAGCNGAGKTTTSYTVLPEILNCKEFVNADEIARGLSPFQPETVSFQAGRIMLSRIKELVQGTNDFAFETTLSTKSYVPLIEEAKKNGYSIVLIFFLLDTVELAKARVRERVEKGGHNIPQDVIERRYLRGRENFFSLYRVLCDNWLVYDNSFELPEIIAIGQSELTNTIYNYDLWKKFEIAK
ncbi:MAG: zeta toxin family protein [Cyclobacteriaceae bacterium]